MPPMRTRDTIDQGAVRSETRIRKFDHDCDDGHGSACEAFEEVARVEWQLPNGEIIDHTDPRYEAWERRYREQS